MFIFNKKSDQLKFNFVISSTLVGLVSFWAFPVLSTWALLTLALNLALSLEKWWYQDHIPAPEGIKPDLTMKYLLGFAIFAMGLKFYFITASSQLIAGTVGCFLLSAYFITHCIIVPQEKLNSALALLLNADGSVADPTPENINKVREYLNRGAERVIRHEEQITLRSVFAQMQPFRTDVLFANVKTWYQALKTLVRHPSQEKHYLPVHNAMVSIVEELWRPFDGMFKRSFPYLQQQTYQPRESEQNEQKDHASCTANDIDHVSSSSPSYKPLNDAGAAAATAAKGMPPPASTLNQGKPSRHPGSH